MLSLGSSGSISGAEHELDLEAQSSVGRFQNKSCSARKEEGGNGKKKAPSVACGKEQGSRAQVLESTGQWNNLAMPKAFHSFIHSVSLIGHFLRPDVVLTSVLTAVNKLRTVWWGT